MDEYEYEDYSAGYEVVPPRFRRDGIRPAREDDAEGILYWSSPRLDVREWQGRIRNGGVFVADEPEEEQNLRGFIYAEAEGDVGHIRQFHHERRRGIAPLLMKAAKRYLGQSGCKTVEMLTDLYNPEDPYAKPDGSFWTRFGFARDADVESEEEPNPGDLYLFRCALADEPKKKQRVRRVRPRRQFPPH